MKNNATKKLRIKSVDDDAYLNSGESFSFLNFASLSCFFEQSGYDEIIYFCDGILMALLCTLVTRKKVHRKSFDFTSLAPNVFSDASKNGLPLFLVGAEDAEIVSFVRKIESMYPDLKVVGFHSGYFSEDEKKLLIAEIIASPAKIVIAGLGAGKQESFLREIKKNGFNGTSFTCGGFIRQEAFEKKQYYPLLIDKYNLRAFYRMYREPHTIKRYFFNYPINMIVFIYFCVVGKLRVVVA